MKHSDKIFTIHSLGRKYKRIQKRTARRLYYKGFEILINPCNLDLDYESWTHIRFAKGFFNSTFDCIVNEYAKEYCNKNDGNRVMFLIEA